ncbi:MAG: ABC transporter substrate-binding protein [Halopseudomonas aestusnigri]
MAWINKFLSGIRAGGFIFLITIILFGNNALSEKPDKIYTIGISVWTGYPDSVKGFKDALKSHGLEEGKNVTFLYRKSGSDKIRQREIAKEFRDENVDMVYTLTTPGTTIIKEELSEDTPIVFSIVTYPADSGLIDSFEFSGNNLVGTSNYISLRHYVKLFKTLLPEAKKAAIFHREGEPNSKIQALNLVRLLKKKGVEPTIIHATTVADIKEKAAALIGQVDAFVTTTDTLMQGGGEEALIALSLQHHVPILSSNKSGVEAGSTFGPVADFFTLGQLSGNMAADILLNDTDPSRLESKLQDPPLFLINRKSAETIGLDIKQEEISNAVLIN